ncbi:MAG TPA: permease-like cell division protein FtsX, partial [Myxococcaceae bacterium]|nr:permease-like cell division protein FtsX [Myxococcaceae bacterium]
MSAVAKAQTFWRSAMEGIRHQPFVHAVSTITLAIALFTLGLARSAAHELDRLVGSLGGEVRVTVYLDPRAPSAARTAVGDGLRSRGMVVEEVSPRAALERLVRELGPAADSLRGLSEDPLPPSLEVRVPESMRGPASLRALAAELRGTPAVTGVDYGEQAVERLSSIARAVRWAGWVAFVVLVGATLIIVSATLQLAIYARREEVEIQKLVGATDRFVQAPFLLEGALQGLAGAALAIAGLIAFRQTVSPQLVTLLSFLRLHGAGADARPWMEALELALAGAGLGLAGS